eukprot:3639429-Alexandrium_andersonii.AAC.1
MAQIPARVRTCACVGGGSHLEPDGKHACVRTRPVGRTHRPAQKRACARDRADRLCLWAPHRPTRLRRPDQSVRPDPGDHPVPAPSGRRHPTGGDTHDRPRS